MKVRTIVSAIRTGTEHSSSDEKENERKKLRIGESDELFEEVSELNESESEETEHSERELRSSKPQAMKWVVQNGKAVQVPIEEPNANATTYDKDVTR